jgi:hypothetical protein
MAEVLEKAFRGVAVDQAERFSQVVRNGLLTGETTPSIAKRLIGNDCNLARKLQRPYVSWRSIAQAAS